jgi:DNA-binding GntR family transcriptional regulator
MAELLRHNVYQIIRQVILTCKFKPGQELREQVLAEMYHVSRSPVRDSLLRLEQENLVTVLPRQGYRVNPIAISDVDDIFGFRIIIEPACAAEAAKADDVELQTLNRFREFSNGGAGLQTFGEYNRAFHRAVAEISGNRRMAAVACTLVEEVDRLILTIIRLSPDISTTHLSQEHDRIIDAIQARDADTAYRLAREHVDNAHNSIRAALRTPQAPPLDP